MQFVRAAMPQQHRDFFAAQHLLYIGRQPRGGGPPDATVAAGLPGFVTAPDPHTLVLRLDLMDAATRPEGFAIGEHLGIVGLQLHDRRRNRLNGIVESVDGAAVRVAVQQSFGNCPKYIQRRALQFAPSVGPGLRRGVSTTSGEGPLPRAHARLVRAADTFFVASAYGGSHTRGVGADMSHRGGAAGFVRVLGGGAELAWGDYAGNGMFMTLGNLLVNPACSLLFVDYATGDALTVYGAARVELDPGASPAGRLPGAERTVTVRVSGWRHVAASVPVASHTWLEASPYNPPDAGGSDGGGDSGRGAVEPQPLMVLSVTQEAEGVKTIELAAPPGGAPRGGLAAGMHAAFAFPKDSIGVGVPAAHMTRTWTVSSVHPGGALADGGSFTITVKRQPGGLASGYLHDAVSPGDGLSFLGFGGDFTLDLLGEHVREHASRDGHVGSNLSSCGGSCARGDGKGGSVGTSTGDASGGGGDGTGGGQASGRSGSSVVASNAGGCGVVSGAASNVDGGTGDSVGPVVLLGGGIGVTPLRPFLAELASGARGAREVVVLLSCQTHAQAVFADELIQTARASTAAATAAETGARVTTVVTATRGGGPAGALPSVRSLTLATVVAAGGGLRAVGRLGHRELSALVPRLAEASVFMCGPPAFMEAMERALVEAGADARRVHHESFAY